METPVRPSGWYHGWNIVGVLVVSQLAANALTYYSFPLFVPLTLRENTRTGERPLASAT